MLQMVRETAAIKIHYIRQREMKGLGDAILCAKAFMGGEIQLTDALRVLAHREPVYAYDFEGTRYDVGDKLGFLKATVEQMTFHRGKNKRKIKRIFLRLILRLFFAIIQATSKCRLAQEDDDYGARNEKS